MCDILDLDKVVIFCIQLYRFLNKIGQSIEMFGIINGVNEKDLKNGFVVIYYLNNFMFFIVY